ncbi:hypothetical protein [Pseudoalteromonas sp. TB64]|uniref:hypothetical protein n=1 Tax=Pseudoalteromonas sp. TB64 TaxID=1938600 RepID=UPI0004630CB2|nr:hypothetical protein [Pseudoalteromonas sp. TB64]
MNVTIYLDKSEKILKVLEDNIESIREQSRIHKKAEKALGENSSKSPCLIGPKTEQDYQDMLKDIKESGEGK